MHRAHGAVGPEEVLEPVAVQVGTLHILCSLGRRYGLQHAEGSGAIGVGAPSHVPVLQGEDEIRVAVPVQIA